MLTYWIALWCPQCLSISYYHTYHTYCYGILLSLFIKPYRIILISTMHYLLAYVLSLQLSDVRFERVGGSASAHQYIEYKWNWREATWDPKEATPRHIGVTLRTSFGPNWAPMRPYAACAPTWSRGASTHFVNWTRGADKAAENEIPKDRVFQ